jgi:hypothetical protein
MKKIANCTGHLFFPCDPVNITRCYVSVAVRNAAGNIVKTLSSKRSAETRRLAFMLFKKEVGQHLGRVLNRVECPDSPSGLQNARSACSLRSTGPQAQVAALTTNAVHPTLRTADEPSTKPEPNAGAQDPAQVQATTHEEALNGLQYSFLGNSPPVKLPHIPRRSPFQNPPPARYKRTQPPLPREPCGAQQETQSQASNENECNDQQQAPKPCSVSKKCRHGFCTNLKKFKKRIPDSNELEGLLNSFELQKGCRSQHEREMTKPITPETVKQIIKHVHECLMEKLGDAAVKTRSISTIGTAGRIGKCIASKFHHSQHLPG